MTALWLAWRDLSARRLRFAVVAGIVAAAVALVVTCELLSRAREEVVGVQVDQIAAPLVVIPSGVDSSARARLEPGEGLLAPGTALEVRRVLGGDLRSVEEVLVVTGSVAGDAVPVVGVAALEGGAREGEGVAGALLAERAGSGATLVVAGRGFPIAAALAPRAGIEDGAAFLRLGDLRAAIGRHGATSELRVYLRPGSSARDAESRLRASLPGVRVLRADRGDVADRDMQLSLAQHRLLLYLVTTAIVAACLFLAAHLDAKERRVELATLVAVGATGGLLCAALALRSALVGISGGLTGAALGVTLALVAGSVLAPASVAIGAFATASAALVSGFAALPTAVACALRDPVRDLQEGAA